MGHTAAWEIKRQHVMTLGLHRELGIQQPETVYCRHCGWPEAMHHDPLVNDNQRNGFDCSFDECPGFEEV